MLMTPKKVDKHLYDFMSNKGVISMAAYGRLRQYQTTGMQPQPWRTCGKNETSFLNKDQKLSLVYSRGYIDCNHFVKNKWPPSAALSQASNSLMLAFLSFTCECWMIGYWTTLRLFSLSVFTQLILPWIERLSAEVFPTVDSFVIDWVGLFRKVNKFSQK